MCLGHCAWSLRLCTAQLRRNSALGDVPHIHLWWPCCWSHMVVAKGHTEMDPKQDEEDHHVPASSRTQSYLLPLFPFFFFPCFLGPHLWHMEVPRLGVNLELRQLLAYPTAKATLDLSRVCDLHHSSRHHRLLNPPSRARDPTPILMDTSQIHYC